MQPVQLADQYGTRLIALLAFGSGLPKIGTNGLQGILQQRIQAGHALEVRVQLRQMMAHDASGLGDRLDFGGFCRIRCKLLPDLRLKFIRPGKLADKVFLVLPQLSGNLCNLPLVNTDLFQKVIIGDLGMHQTTVTFRDQLLPVERNQGPPGTPGDNQREQRRDTDLQARRQPQKPDLAVRAEQQLAFTEDPRKHTPEPGWLLC